MKKLAVIICVVLMSAPLAISQSLQIGVGAFGGINIPLVQDDQSNGTIFGVLARVKVLPFMAIEPNIAFGKWGQPDPVDGFALGIDGSKINFYGVDAILGVVPGMPGFKPYALAGVGIYNIKNEDTGYDESKAGFNLGLGFGIGIIPKINIDFRGKMMISPQEEGSKKALFITGGLTYNFGLGY